MRFVLGRLSVVLAVVAVSAVAVSSAWASGKPFVETQPATSVSAHEAILHGVVNPNGAETTYWFEYGLTTSYGKKTVEVKAGSGTTSIEVSQVISGLLAEEHGTTYHFRIVAKNVNGTSDGADEVFKTLSSEGACHNKAGGKRYGLCVEKEAPASATAEWAAVTSPEAYFLEGTGESLWAGSPITCESLSAQTAEVKSGESLSLKQAPEIAGCKIGGKLAERCSMPGTVRWAETQGVFSERPEVFRLTNVQGEEHNFFEFETKAGKGECPVQLIGVNVLKGSYKCKVHESEVETVKHIVVCEGGATMTFRGKPAVSHFEASLALTGTYAGKKFRIYEHS